MSGNLRQAPRRTTQVQLPFLLDRPADSQATAPQETKNSADDLQTRLERIEDGQHRLECLLQQLVEQRTVKDWYSTEEVAQLVGRAEYTIREYCRLGRILAKKKPCGRGKGGEWLISHEALQRLRNFGPAPEPKVSQRPA